MGKPNEIDIFHDPSFKMLAQRILEVPEIEPYVKQASLDIEEHASLPDSAFAWEERRLYPIHSAEHAALSYLYATGKEASAPSEVLETLQDALRGYGVVLDFPMAKEAAAEVESLDDYLLPERRRWRVTDAETVKHAELALHNYATDLLFEERVQAATRLVKKASEFGASLEPGTHQLAGNTYSDLDTAIDWVEVRAAMAPEGYNGAYTKIANSLGMAETFSKDRDSLVKLAATIHELDKASGLADKYGYRLPDPMQTVFNTSKVAEESVELAGVHFPLHKLAALPQTVYEDIFGKEILPEITSGNSLDTSKIATVIPTMPRDLLSIFARQIKPYVR